MVIENFMIYLKIINYKCLNYTLIYINYNQENHCDSFLITALISGVTVTWNIEKYQNNARKGTQQSYHKKAFDSGEFEFDRSLFNKI